MKFDLRTVFDVCAGHFCHVFASPRVIWAISGVSRVSEMLAQASLSGGSGNRRRALCMRLSRAKTDQCVLGSSSRAPSLQGPESNEHVLNATGEQATPVRVQGHLRSILHGFAAQRRLRFVRVSRYALAPSFEALVQGARRFASNDASTICNSVLHRRLCARPDAAGRLCQRCKQNRWEREDRLLRRLRRH